MSQNLNDLEKYAPSNRLLDIFSKNTRPEKKVWEQVKEMEESILSQPEKVEYKIRELDEFKATAMVNFGPNGRYTKGIVTESQTATQMLFEIVELFIKSENRNTNE